MIRYGLRLAPVCQCQIAAAKASSIRAMQVKIPVGVRAAVPFQVELVFAGAEGRLGPLLHPARSRTGAARPSDLGAQAALHLVGGYRAPQSARAGPPQGILLARCAIILGPQLLQQDVPRLR